MNSAHSFTEGYEGPFDQPKKGDRVKTWQWLLLLIIVSYDAYMIGRIQEQKKTLKVSTEFEQFLQKYSDHLDDDIKKIKE